MSKRLVADVTGLIIALFGATWAVVTAAVAGWDGIPTATWTYTAVIAAYLAARVATRIDSAVVPLVIVAAAAVVIAVESPSEVYSAAPLGGPFGYSNATASFYLQCTIASVVLLSDRRLVVRVVAAVATVVFAAVPFSTGTETAIVLLAVPILAIGARWLMGAHRAITAIGIVAAVAVAASFVVAMTYSGADEYDDEERRGFDRVLDATLSLRRVELQHDAFELMLDHPIAGVGPDRFDDVSDAVARDPDSPWAHNGYLQHGAESGVPGLVALVAVAAWGFARLRTSIGRRRRSVIVASALAALAIHASVEHVVERPAVPAVTAALVGSAVHLHTRWRGPTRWEVDDS